jgi:hypothetical protein
MATSDVDLVERLRWQKRYTRGVVTVTQEDAAAEIERLREFVGWVESWVSNPVGSYSVAALDGLFSMTRDRIAVLESLKNGKA